MEKRAQTIGFTTMSSMKRRYKSYKTQMVRLKRWAWIDHGGCDSCLWCWRYQNEARVRKSGSPRHGAIHTKGLPMLLRNFVRLVIKQFVTRPVPNRPIVDALTLNTKDLHFAAAGRLSRTGDAVQILVILYRRVEGRILWLMERGFLSKARKYKRNETASSDCCNIGWKLQT